MPLPDGGSRPAPGLGLNLMRSAVPGEATPPPDAWPECGHQMEQLLVGALKELIELLNGLGGDFLHLVLGQDEAAGGLVLQNLVDSGAGRHDVVVLWLNLSHAAPIRDKREQRESVQYMGSKAYHDL